MPLSTASSAGPTPHGPKPVFVFPSTLDFYLEDPTTHKRVLTLYNPYDQDITFKVLCNNPKKYVVVEPEGRISAQKICDIVVRHIAISPAAVQQTDKFRIHIFEEGCPDVAGKKDVLATLHPGMPDQSETRHSSSLPHRPTQTSLPPDHTTAYPAYTAAMGAGGVAESHQPNYIACLAAIVCIAALFLPTEGEQVLQDYPYLQLTVNQKLVFAYVLGLVTMAILRTT